MSSKKTPKKPITSTANQIKNLARAPLPTSVNAVGDRIGLDYGIDRKKATRQYVEENQGATRLDFEHWRNSYYSLSEAKTRKGVNPGDNAHISSAKNTLKLNAKIRKTLYKLTQYDKDQLKYTTFERIYGLWQDYFKKVTTDKDPMSIFRADLHGCKLECTVSKNPTLVGQQGIVVQETRNTFLIITSGNRVLTLPKRESIFEFKLDNKRYRINGCNLLFTTQTRSKVKFKQRKCQLDL